MVVHTGLVKSTTAAIVPLMLLSRPMVEPMSMNRLLREAGMAADNVSMAQIIPAETITDSRRILETIDVGNYVPVE